MSRFKDAEEILAAAAVWKQRCLLQAQSLFTDRLLWTRERFDELRLLFIENEDVGSRSFLEKLRDQLAPGSRDAKCLWAEMAWVYRLIVRSSSIRADTKLAQIREIWGWSGRDSELSSDHRLLRDEVLEGGVADPGTAYNTHMWSEYRFFVTAMLDWFSLDARVRVSRAHVPWEFAEWLDGTEFAANRMFRHVMLFLLFPDDFEPIVSGKLKEQIVKAVHWRKGDPPDRVTLDKWILEIRRRIEAASDGEEVLFYRTPYDEFWQVEKAKAWYRKRFGDRNVWMMNMNVNGEPMWPAVAQDGVASIGWDEVGDLRSVNPKEQLISLGHGPDPKIHALALWQFAQKIRIGDIIVATRKGKRGLGWGRVEGDYRYDSDGTRFRVHTRAVDWRVCDNQVELVSNPVSVQRLTRVSVWPRWLRRAFWLLDGRAKPLPRPYTLDHATRDLFIPRDRFERFLALLETRKNLILQGPPGTGKTFVARRLAWCRIGFRDDDPIEMVQFHQSYAYEDFVQGYRPTESGGFKLKNGTFHRFCEQARANPDTPHVFIIDEINRGNLSRIFGELLMLIEADKRSEAYAVALTYADRSQDRFHVPANVHILGMMNTADRSLALVDYALRRRFAFQTLSPAYENDRFREYIREKGAAPALIERITGRMAELNRTIRDDNELGPGFEIGHSYFVPDDGVEPSDDWYEEVVDSQIEPLLREYWFDSPERVAGSVGRLKGGVSS